MTPKRREKYRRVEPVRKSPIKTLAMMLFGMIPVNPDAHFDNRKVTGMQGADEDAKDKSAKRRRLVALVSRNCRSTRVREV